MFGLLKTLRWFFGFFRGHQPIRSQRRRAAEWLVVLTIRKWRDVRHILVTFPGFHMFTSKSDACCYDYEPSDLINLNCVNIQLLNDGGLTVCVCASVCVCVFFCVDVCPGESWQKTLLIHSVSRDGLRRQIQPKLSKYPSTIFFRIVTWLIGNYASIPSSDSLSVQGRLPESEAAVSLWKWKAAVKTADRWPGERDWIAQVNVSFCCLHHVCYDKEDKVCLSLHREKKEGDLTGDRCEDLDWQKISNIDVG